MVDVPAVGSGPLASRAHLRVNGADAPARLLGRLVGVTVHDDVGQAGKFTLQFADDPLAASASRLLADEGLLAPGHEVEVQLGYGRQVSAVMVGDITGLEVDFAVADRCTVIVRGHDRRHRLMRGHHTRAFVEVTDSEIVTQVAAEHGVAVDAESTASVHDHVVQQNETDLSFLLRRARRIGYELTATGTTLQFRARRSAAEPSLSLRRGDNLLDLAVRLNMVGQAGSVAVHGWDGVYKQPVRARAEAADSVTPMGGGTTGPAAADAVFGAAELVSATEAVAAGEEADVVADALLNDVALRYVCAEGRCVGDPALRAGRVVAIEGFGQRFSGPYYLTDTAHRYVPGSGYVTSFRARRNTA